MNIGYVGLGHMGGALAKRLQLKRQLRVYDLSETAVAELVESGAWACANLAELARDCEIIFLCLPTSAHVRSVLLEGGDSIVENARKGTIVVDQTTGDPMVTRTLAAELENSGLELIDAPVSGGPRGAEAGSIAIMVGGNDRQMARIEPLLNDISSNVFRTGEVGTGHVMKLANNMLAAAHRAITLESICLAVKNGIDPAKAVDVMLKGAGRNHFMEYSMKPHIISGKLAQGFTLGLMHKDVRLATQLGVESDTPLLFGNLVREFYQMCINEMGRDSEVNTAALVLDRICKTNVVPEGYTT